MNEEQEKYVNEMLDTLLGIIAMQRRGLKDGDCKSRLLFLGKQLALVSTELVKLGNEKSDSSMTNFIFNFS